MLTRNEEHQEYTGSQTQEQRSGTGSGVWKIITISLRGLAQFILMVAVLFGGIYGMNRLTALKEERTKRPPFQTVYTVQSVIAEQGSFQPDMLVYGEVQASKTIELRPLVTGKIIEINPDLRVGAPIEKGELLFRIDPFSFETALDTARSNAAETRARIAENEANISIEKSRIRNLKDQLEIAKSDLDRISQLRSRGTATAKDVEDRRLIVSQRTQALEQSELNLVAENARLEQQKNVLSRFERSVEQAERDLADTSLHAPVSGVVSANNSAIGRYIGPSDMTVSMYEADRLEVRFTLTDQRFGRIQSDNVGVIGRPVEVIWSIGGEEFRYNGEIDRIGAQIASARGGVEVIAVIDGKLPGNQLRPGAFVEIIVPDKSFSDRFMIPETAVYDGETIYVINEGKLEERKIRILARDGDQVILGGELKEGDEVMTTRIAEISRGLRVRTNNNASVDEPREEAVSEAATQ